MNKPFQSLPHIADIKYKITGKSLNEIFENSAMAFSDYISSGKTISLKKKRTIKIQGDDLQSLLYKFLDELTFLLDAENFAISKARVKVEEKSFCLIAYLEGDSIKDYQLNHIKAATYSDMEVKRTGKSWKAIFVLDV
jgi:SHS2 domain-containing protein